MSQEEGEDGSVERHGVESRGGGGRIYPKKKKEVRRKGDSPTTN